jgi:hypothetical protein
VTGDDIATSICFGRAGSRCSDDGESFKVRRGKVGGYTDYFDAEEQNELNDVVGKSLSPFFGPLLSPS